MSSLLWRYIWSLISKKAILVSVKKDLRILLVGEGEELERVHKLLRTNQPLLSFCGWVSTHSEHAEPYVGSTEDLPDLVRVFQIDEIIFCSDSLPAEAIFRAMRNLQDFDLEFKIAPSESQFIIGSNSIHSQGSWYTQDFNSVDKPENRRAKRILDFTLAAGLLLISPLIAWFFKKPFQFIGNVLQVLIGRKTWVAYAENGRSKELPELAPGVLGLDLALQSNRRDEAIQRQLNQLYAKDYDWQKDMAFIWQYRKSLGK